MSEKVIEPYDLEAVYDEEISPLMVKIIEVCKRHRMPMMASFQYAYSADKGDGQCTTALGFEERASARLLRSIHEIQPKQPSIVRITTKVS